MKFKIGDVIVDPRDGEVTEIVKIEFGMYLLKGISPGNGGPGGGWGRLQPGEDAKRPCQELDNEYTLSESHKVLKTLEKYE